MLVGDLVLLEQLFHFFRNHFLITGDRDNFQFFPYFGPFATGGASRGVTGVFGRRLFFRGTHGEIDKVFSLPAAYSNDSSEDCSGN